MPLSRRQFLESLGIAAAASNSAFRFDPGFVPPIPSEPLPTQGRALRTVTMRSQPNDRAVVLRHLWEDEVFPIHSTTGRWFKTDQGYISFGDAQPMINQPSAQLNAASLPCWAEVTAPAAVLRTWCADDAPITARIGHGGVMRIIDRLAVRETVWVAVADESDGHTGWSRAAAWSSIRAVSENARIHNLVIDREAKRAIIREGKTPVLDAAVTLGAPLPSGRYDITAAFPGATTSLDGQVRRQGTAWVLESGNVLRLGGVYWHNDFGSYKPGLEVQLPIPLARALYSRVRSLIIA